MKKLGLILVVGLFLTIALAGCESKATVNTTTNTTKVDATKSAVNNSTEAAETGSPQETESGLSNLKSWKGDYVFYEFAPPDENMIYSISIYNEGESYIARISIDGFQTNIRLQAKVIGNKDCIKLIFDKYLPDNGSKLYKAGDILLILKKINQKLYTYWGSLKPLLKRNEKSGNVYFEYAPKFSSNQLNVGNLALDGLKALIQVNYTDSNYNGTNGGECFSISFRTSQIFNKAYERLKLVRSQKLIRSINNYEFLNIELDKSNAVVDLECKLSISKKGSISEVSKTFRIWLVDMGGGTWYISNINPILFP